MRREVRRSEGGAALDVSLRPTCKIISSSPNPLSPPPPPPLRYHVLNEKWMTRHSKTDTDDTDAHVAAPIAIDRSIKSQFSLKSTSLSPSLFLRIPAPG